MTQNQVGCQTVGCRVTSCRYNDKGSYCELSRIQIEPCCCKTAETAIPPMRAFAEVTAENKTKSWRGA